MLKLTHKNEIFATTARAKKDFSACDCVYIDEQWIITTDRHRLFMTKNTGGHPSGLYDVVKQTKKECILTPSEDYTIDQAPQRQHERVVPKRETSIPVNGGVHCHAVMTKNTPENNGFDWSLFPDPKLFEYKGASCSVDGPALGVITSEDGECIAVIMPMNFE